VLRKTMVGGTTYADDFKVIRRKLPIGRIMRASGVPAHAAISTTASGSSGRHGDVAGGAYRGGHRHGE
jgi:hypothetical protein